MNERIKELAEQAFEYTQNVAESTRPSPTKPQQISSSELKEIYNQKFAELIVRECCFVGEQYADGLFDSKQYAFVNKKIKEHFGVEE